MRPQLPAGPAPTALVSGVLVSRFLVSRALASAALASKALVSTPLVSTILAATALAGVVLASNAVAQGLPQAPRPVPGSLLDRGAPPAGATVPPAPAAPTAPGSAPTRRLSSGSGFYVTADGHLITNFHVVNGCQRLGRGDGTELTLLATDPANDLALLKGPAVFDAARLRASPAARQGEDVLTYGFPLQGMLSSSGQLNAGMVSALAGLRDNAGQLQIDVPVQPGNSGGPLLDRHGHVVGVVVAKLNALRVAQITGDIPQNINFAIKLAPVLALLESQRISYQVGDLSARALSNLEIADAARSFTTAIWCQR